jgi:hypothetical protein
MRRHFLAYRDRPDHAEGNVAPLTEEFAIVVAVMVDESGRAQKEMVFLELL